MEKEERQQMLKEQEEYFKTLPTWGEIKDLYVFRNKRTKRNVSEINKTVIRDKGLCRKCGRDYHTNAHHVWSLCYQGKDKAYNMITLCLVMPQICSRDTKING